MTLNQVKLQEARKRMTAFAIGSPGAEAGGETATPRVFGGDVTWRITDFKQVTRAMAGWEHP